VERHRLDPSERRSAMRWVRVFVATAASALVVASAATAGTIGPPPATLTDTIAGFETRFAEVSPGIEASTFLGGAAGDLPGPFRAVVTHTPLAPGGTIIDDGADRDFWLRPVDRPGRTRLVGEFTGGSITPVSAEPGCGRQTFAVDADLTLRMGSRTGTGTVDALLTHFRFALFGQCVTFFARVNGTAVFEF